MNCSMSEVSTFLPSPLRVKGFFIIVQSALKSERPFTRCAPQSAEMESGLTPQTFSV